MATPNHWASQETLFSFLAHVQEELGAEQPWLCMLDCAPIHIAAEFRDNVSLLLPNCHLCFIDAGATSILQPLDIGYFRSFKNHMAAAWAEAFAGEVLASTSGIGLVTKTPALRANLAQLVSSAMDFVNTPQRGLASWKHILVEPAQVDSILAEADILHAAGGLFSKLEPDEGETMEYKEQDADDEIADGSPPDDAALELEAEAAAAAGTAADPGKALPEPELPDAEPVIPEAMPKSSTEQLSKWVALALVYGNPNKRQLEAGAAAATFSGAASSSTSRWATNKLFQSQGLPSICPCPGRPLIHQTYGLSLALCFSGFCFLFF